MKKKEKINRSGKNKWVVVLFLFFFPFLCSPNLSFAFPEKEAEAVWQSTDKKVTLKMTGKTLAHILSGIKAQTGLSYGFRDTPDAARNGLYSIDVKNVSVEEALNTLLKGSEFTYTIESGWILIRTRQEHSPSDAVYNRVTVKGRVVDEKEQPMPGVTVMLKGTGIGAVTGVEGEYRLDFPEVENVALVFSFVGMKTQEVKYTGQPELNIVMQEDVAQMDEVVVTGIFKKARESYTGAVSTIGKEEILAYRGQNMLQTLRNIDPAFNVVQNNEFGSDPNRLPDITVRGSSSLTTNLKELNEGTKNDLNVPLIIMDDFEISLTKLMDYNEEEIESINILKDAAATAIYGSRGANGVVVITTKRGLALDKAKVTFRTQLGISQLAQDKWNQMNTEERILFEKEVGLDKGKDYDLLRKTDINWLDVVFNDKAMLQNYEVSVNRATDRLNYYVSGNFFDQDGIAQGSGFRRYNMRANADVKASNWLKVGTTSTVSYEDIEQAQTGEYTSVTPISASHFMMPYWNPYNEDGSIASTKDDSWTGTNQNPLDWMRNNPVSYKKYKVLSTLYAEVNPIKGLTIKSQFAADYAHMTAFRQSFPSFSTNNGSGNAGRSSNDRLSLTITNTANYMFTLREKHSFNFLLGQEGGYMPL